MRSFVYILSVMAIGLALSTGAGADSAKPETDVQAKCSFEKTIKKTVHCNYLLYLPEDYGKDKKKSWPLVLFLHGAGERGNDVSVLKMHGPTHMIDQGKKFPFILVAPQCPEGGWWTYQTDVLKALLDDMESKYKVDKKREYLTGLSMGGFGTWALAAEQPNRFAAIAPICGGGDPKTAPLIKDIPMWVFHGDKDSVIPIKNSQDMVDAVKAAGGNPKFTIYPGVDHNSWTQTYENEDFWKWLLDQHK